MCVTEGEAVRVLTINGDSFACGCAHAQLNAYRSFNRLHLDEAVTLTSVLS